MTIGSVPAMEIAAARLCLLRQEISVSIVTTEPNELVAQIHDRLALILHPRDYDRLLDIDEKGGESPAVV